MAMMEVSSSSIAQKPEMEKIGSFTILRLKILKRKKPHTVVTLRHLPTDFGSIPMSIKFRPMAISPAFRLRSWLKFGRKENYNFIDRTKDYRLSSFPTVYRIGSQLHYLADHAPVPIQQKWKSAFRKFCERYRKF